MAEIFPTPSAARDAMIAVGWEVVDADDYIDAHEHPDYRGVTAALVATTRDGEEGCTPALVKVTRDDAGQYLLTGHASGKFIGLWAATDPYSTDEYRKPLLMWIDAEVEVLDRDDPRAQDRHHDSMPADPFGETPAHAQLATDGIELKTMLDTYIGAGFTRAEAFELVLAIHQTELDHTAQHCLIERQIEADREGGEQ